MGDNGDGALFCDQQPEPTPGSRSRKGLRPPLSPARRGVSPEPVLVGVLALVWVLFSIKSPVFRTPQNYLDIATLIAEPGLVALAMTLIIITGGIDLSVGSIVALSAVTLGLAWQSQLFSIWSAVAAGVLVGVLSGTLNGGLIVFFRIPPLIVTLATMAILRGIAMGTSHGLAVSQYDPAFYTLGQGCYSIAGLKVPFQAVVLAGAAVVSFVFLSRTRWGRYLYAIGMNETASRYAALPVDRVKLCVYALSGLMSGLASAVFVSRVATAKADAGLYMELDAITACVLGGVSIYGGRGSIPGTLLGLLIVGSLRRGLDLSRVVASTQSIYIGAVLILAVFAHQVLVPALQNRALRPSLRRGDAES